MFHTLFDFKEQNSDSNKKYQKSNNDTNNFNNIFQFSGINDNYFGKGNIVIDQYNKKKDQMENDAKFEKTKNKVKLVVYKNGFILNNGQFRDRTIYKNKEFLDEVEKGNIPQELIKKGITDLGILLINRKTEMYRSPLYQSLPTSFDFLNISKNSYNLQYNNQNLNPYLTNENNHQNKVNPKPHFKYDNAFFPQTPMIERPRKNIFYNAETYKAPNKYEENKNIKRTNSLPKDKKFMTLSDLMNVKKEKEKKFTAFSGSGLLLGSANIDGIRVDQLIKDNEYLSTNNFGFDGFTTTSQVDYGIRYDEFVMENANLTQMVY